LKRSSKQSGRSTNMNYKMIIVGNEHAIAGFKAVGLDTAGVKNKEHCESIIKDIFNSSTYGIIFITEDWADKIKDFLTSLPPQALPAVVAIPSQAGSTGAGLNNLKKIVEQAVGSDILSNN